MPYISLANSLGLYFKKCSTPKTFCWEQIYLYSRTTHTSKNQCHRLLVRKLRIGRGYIQKEGSNLEFRIRQQSHPIWKDYYVTVSRKRKRSIQNTGFITFLLLLLHLARNSNGRVKYPQKIKNLIYQERKRKIYNAHCINFGHRRPGFRPPCFQEMGNSWEKSTSAS